ncbi:hypothetical protein LTS10_007769 [Elasticomyces elasticus]|nr:hypothetical protein LTS10_007769 [Elasticomyces elasticus]
MARLFNHRRRRRAPVANHIKAKAAMPPISEDGSDDIDIPDAIPAKAAKMVADAEPEAEAEEEDEEEGEDEYRVEKILLHDFDKKGNVIYQIKWLGYENDEDLTWEPIENLDGAKEILRLYHKKIGGPPEPKSIKKGKGKRGASDAFAADSPAPTSSKKKGRKSNGAAATESEEPAQKTRELPVGSWDDHVLRVTSIIEEVAPVKGTGKGTKETKQLIGLLEWKDKEVSKTSHKMKVLRQKVPQRLLDYYELHLVFTPDDLKNGEEAKAE